MTQPDTDSHESPRRCAAAHPDDGSPCEGDQAAVRIVVGTDEVLACIHHGTRLYASVEHAQVYPTGGPNGPNREAALEIPRRAVGMKPFFWMTAASPPAKTTRHRLHGPAGPRRGV
jgi:hypothetical protein